MLVSFRIDGGHDFLQQADGRVGAHTPLLVDDPALVVDVLVGEQQSVGPVVKNPETGVDGRRNGGHRHIVDVVNGLIEAGLGVQVLTEFHTDALAITDNTVAGKVLGAVEAHVLQKMRQTSLVLLFQDGADLLRDVEVGLTFRLLIVADVIGDSVVQFSDSDGRINRDGAHLGKSTEYKQHSCHRGNDIFSHCCMIFVEN